MFSFVFYEIRLNKWKKLRMTEITISNIQNDPYTVHPVCANIPFHQYTYRWHRANVLKNQRNHHPEIAMNRNSRYSNHQDVAMCRMHLHNRHVSILAYFFSAYLFLIHAFVGTATLTFGGIVVRGIPVAVASAVAVGFSRFIIHTAGTVACAVAEFTGGKNDVFNSVFHDDLSFVCYIISNTSSCICKLFIK